MTFSYQSLRSVLLYLEPNLRMHLSLQCPSLQSPEKNVPVHIYELTIIGNRMKINKKIYSLTMKLSNGETYQGLESSEGLESTPDEIVHIYRNKPQSTIDPIPYYIEFSIHKNGATIHREMLDGKVHEAQKYLIGKLLGGRLAIYAQHFTIFNRHILRLPADLMIRVQILMLEGEEGDDFLPAIRPILDPSSFPLKGLLTMSETKFEDPIHQNCRLLILAHGYGLSTVYKKANSPRKVLVTHFGLSEEDELSPLVKHWMENGRELLTEYRFEFDDNFKAKEFMENVRETYSDRILKQCICTVRLSMNEETELCITRDINEQRENKIDVKLSVQPKYGGKCQIM